MRPSSRREPTRPLFEHHAHNYYFLNEEGSLQGWNEVW